MDLKKISKNQWKILILSVVCFIFGILFCVLSNSMVEFLRTAICVIALIYGSFYLVSYTVLSFEDKDTSALFQAVIAIVLGLLVIFIPSFFVMAISICVVVCGLARMFRVIKKKSETGSINKAKLSVGIAELIVGLALVVLCNTPVPTLLVTIYLGVMLILESAVNAIFLWLELKEKQPQTSDETLSEKKVNDSENSEN